MRRSPVRTIGAALAAGLIAGGWFAAPEASASHLLKPGIDVSNHQGVIHWDEVAASGEVFALVKATEGITFDDPRYVRNRSRARRNGLLAGAYHFARPQGSSSAERRADALAEADHFLGFGNPRSGDLYPVLDLEVTGGLGVPELQEWTRAWLERVAQVLGVKGIIYTSPSFWRTQMGNTTWFAEQGYRALWIAHWDVPEPDVPAENWNGRGWRFWQYTSCGSVPGIRGCVDRDRFRGRSLSVVQLP